LIHNVINSKICCLSLFIDVLHFIGKNEGCFDAVNSYDKAIFSFGFIQFTGASASGSILSKVLQRMKQNNSDAFIILLASLV
jgi:peptidoglycan endopeptidase LytF